MGGKGIASPSCLIKPGRMDIFLVGDDHNVYQKVYNNVWGEWVNIGGPVQ